jgi:hypothetical protein
LKHSQSDYQTVIPATHSGLGAVGVIGEIWCCAWTECVEQNGSMAPPTVFASAFAAVLASIGVVSTSVVVFDARVVGLRPALSDLVEVLFGTQLAGGTDINRTRTDCQGRSRGSMTASC